MPAQPASSDYWSHESVDLLLGIGQIFDDTEQSKLASLLRYTGFVNYPTTLRLKGRSDDTQAYVANGSPENGTINTSGIRPERL